MTRKNFLETTLASVGAAAMSRGGTMPGGAELYPVPPLARKNDAKRSLNTAENERLFRYMVEQGIKHVVYAGNALVYHMRLAEYTELIEWLSSLTEKASIIPAVGPSYGRAMDEAAIARKGRFDSLLVLPSTSDPRDAAGLEAGLREIANTAGIPLSLYIKEESNFGSDKEAGLDAIGRLVDSKVCIAIKYAVVRKNPAEDPYLHSLLKRVDASRVVSGIGERPAVVHLRDFKLAGFTTGSGVIAPKLSLRLLESCMRGDYAAAEQARQAFLPLEDLRDTWGAPAVLHHAVALAGIAETGPLQPFLSPLAAGRLEQIKPAARALYEKNAA